jgi:hypothetical protein
MQITSLTLSGRTGGANRTWPRMMKRSSFYVTDSETESYFLMFYDILKHWCRRLQDAGNIPDPEWQEWWGKQDMVKDEDEIKIWQKLHFIGFRSVLVTF